MATAKELNAERRNEAFTNEAPTRLRERDWPGLSSVSEGIDRFDAQLLAAWSMLELGQTDAGVQRLKTLLSKPFTPEDHTSFRLWELRKRFGPSALLQWGVHELVIGALWSAVEFNRVYGREGFVGEWVGQALRRFGDEIPVEHWAPRPWQLGGAGPIVPESQHGAVHSWVLGHLERLAELTAAEREVLAVLRSGERLAMEALRKRPHQSDLDIPRALDVLMAVARARELEDLCRVFGRWVNAEALEHAKTLMIELDALLLLEEVRGRMPADFAARRPFVRTVVFRASPRRALDVAIAEMNEPGQYGALARHQVPAAAAGKLSSALTWAEGSLDDALAAVPAEHFERAVARLRKT